MLHQACCVATIFGLTLIPATRSSAASLTVSPILVEVSAAASTAAVTLRNREARPVNAQVRVFRWTQRDGEDHLAPTEDVVASPPIVTVQAGEDYTVRLLRITASPPQGESAYRIVVDELPDPNRQRNGTVAVVLRYLIPAFFLSADASQPRLAWSMKSAAGRTWLFARNDGDKRIQLCDLALRSSSRTAWVGRGLAGYVLGHSQRAWLLNGQVSKMGAGVVVATSDHNPINARLEN